MLIYPRKKPLILRITSRMAIGGVQRGILNTLARADREHFDYVLLCTKKEGSWGQRVRDLGYVLLVQRTFPIWHPYQIWRLANVIKQTAPDLVHVHMAATVIPAASAARLAGVRKIVIQHHNVYDTYWNQLNPLMRAWEFKLTREAAAVIAVSEPVAECSRRYLGMPSEKVITIRNGIGLEEFQNAQPHDPRPEWDVASANPLVMLVSRYVENKRIEDFIDAAAMIAGRWQGPGPVPFFAIVGNGPRRLRQMYEDRILALPQPVPIRLVGGRHDLVNLLPHAAVGVITSELEGCPNTILEYLAAGVPIAATNIAPIAAIVRHGEHALLSAPRDPAALAGNIESLLRDRPLAERLVSAGKEIIKDYDWNATIRGYETIYRDILKL